MTRPHHQFQREFDDSFKTNIASPFTTCFYLSCETAVDNELLYHMNSWQTEWPVRFEKCSTHLVTFTDDVGNTTHAIIGRHSLFLIAFRQYSIVTKTFGPRQMTIVSILFLSFFIRKKCRQFSQSNQSTTRWLISVRIAVKELQLAFAVDVL